MLGSTAACKAHQAGQHRCLQNASSWPAVQPPASALHRHSFHPCPHLTEPLPLSCPVPATTRRQKKRVTTGGHSTLHMQPCGLRCISCIARRATEADADLQHRTDCQTHHSTTALPATWCAGEMAVGPIRALFADEISTGLDSNTTFQASAGQQCRWAEGAWLLLSESGWQGCPDAFHSGESCTPLIRRSPSLKRRRLPALSSTSATSSARQWWWACCSRSPRPLTSLTRVRRHATGQAATRCACCGLLGCNRAGAPSLPSAPLHSSAPALWCCSSALQAQSILDVAPQLPAVILLSNGKVCFHGPRELVLPFFEGQGERGRLGPCQPCSAWRGAHGRHSCCS